MKLLYAIASRFAGSGIGRTASHGALGIWRAGHLAGLVCLGHESTAIDESIIADVPFFRRGMLRFVPDKPFYEMKNRWFDRVCRKRIDSGFDSFHCWNSQASGSLEKARDMGLRTVVDRASSHIRTQNEILQKEYARYGIRYDPTYPNVIRRCERDYESADLVVVPSRFAYRSFADRGFDMSKVVFNPFGVDHADFQPRKEMPKEFRVIFVGQVGIRKGAPTLLEAWDMLKLPDAELVLAGGMEPVAKPLLQPWSDRKDVRFLGFTKDVAGLMSSSSVFAFPSCEEGSALVTYEAMACALPVVVTENSGSVAEDGISGFIVDQSDAEALAERIERLYRDRDLAWEMGLAARKRIEQFPWEAYGDRTAKMHEALLSGASIDEIHQAMDVEPPSI